MGKKSKLRQCSACGKEIASSVKVCPYCGEKFKKPIYKRVWFWILIIFILLAAIGTAGNNTSNSASSDNRSNENQSSASSSGQGENTSAAVEQTEPSTTVPEKETYTVGDTVHLGKLDVVYVSSGEYHEENAYLQPADGKKYIFLKFAFTNTSSNSDASVSSFSFKCYADGYACDTYYGNTEDLSATLSPGRSSSGQVCFIVPKDANDIEVEYESNMLSGKKTKFLYEGEKTSDYSLKADTTTSASSLSVGEFADSSSMKVTYLDCYLDSSNNQFIVPKEGCHYVTCEFEFENKTNSDQIVSYYNFNCFADGISCSATYFRDDGINATLSPGRKAKGTVTFEVPDNATVVEVEYLTNFWTSNRVVFNASIS